MAHYLPLPDGKLYFEVAGNGEPIVFVHGFTLDHRMWAPQVAEFAKTHTVITYDCRGFGQSTPPAGPYAHHDDLMALLAHLNITSAHIVGLSMGGGIAANFAVAYPDAVRTLSLLDADLSGYRSTVNWDVHAQEVGIEGAKQNWLNHPVFDVTNQNPAAAQQCADIVAGYSGWHWLNRDPKKRIDPPTRARLQEIHCPTLIIVGAGDLPYFRDVARVYHEGITGSKLEVIRGAGHMVNLEAPQAIYMQLRAQFVQ